MLYKRLTFGFSRPGNGLSPKNEEYFNWEKTKKTSKGSKFDFNDFF